MTMLQQGPSTHGPESAAIGESRVAIHSHHYNLALVRTVLSTERIDARGILEAAASELAYATLRERAAAERWRGRDRRLAEAVALFAATGLGELELDEVTESGGEARVRGSHFAAGWKEKYGRGKLAACSPAAGFIAGALASVFDRPFTVTEVACGAQDKPVCRFRVTPAEGDLPAAEGPAFAASHLPYPAPPASGLDEAAVVAALLGTPGGQDPDGRIPAFQGAVTRLWSDYYAMVSHRFEREIPRVLGNKFANLPALVLTEAGHSFAFHAFGEILRSDHWWERVVPLLETRDDWVHALVAVINRLGWGSWRVQALVPAQRISVRVYDGYEAAGHLRRFGASSASRCYLARGTVAALMNLVYVGDPGERSELTPSYYNRLFRSPLSFRAVEARCGAMEDPYCELIANPLTSRLLSRME